MFSLNKYFKNSSELYVSATNTIMDFLCMSVPIYYLTYVNTLTENSLNESHATKYIRTYQGLSEYVF